MTPGDIEMFRSITQSHQKKLVRFVDVLHHRTNELTSDEDSSEALLVAALLESLAHLPHAIDIDLNNN